MAYRKKTSYRTARSSYKKAPAKRRATTKRRSAPREQVVKLVLQHVMMSPQAVPTMGSSGSLLPAPKGKPQAKL